MTSAKQEKFITESEYHQLQCDVDSVRRINAQLGKGELNRIKRIEELEKELEEANRFRKNAGVAVVIAQERIEALEVELDKANQSVGHWGGKWGGELLRRCEAEAERDALKAELERTICTTTTQENS